MVKEITVTVKPEEEKNSSFIKSLVLKELKKNGVSAGKEQTLVFVKKSVDARHGQLKLHLRFKVYIDEKPDSNADAVPQWKHADGRKQVIIVGSGPAGLFGALKLLEYGIKPIIIERGAQTSQRKKDIALISTRDLVNENSNYCFGEGGAGTFSDGKLYTRSNKRGDIGSVLKIFAHFGADPKILTDAHPHIGTDRLPQVINNMRNKILELGGEIKFNTLVTDFIIEETGGSKKITGVVFQNTQSKESESLEGDAVVLATGHSATDIYMLVAKKCPEALEAKTFAAGVRVEHPRELIDSIQYHGKMNENLGAAEYRVTAQVNERGVYSFCMCPGGFVVPSSSGPDEIVVNGMSTAARNSKWSNAAIVVEIRPEDIPEEFKQMAQEAGCPDLAGLFFRTKIEQDAKKFGNGQAAPAQKLVDFIDGRISSQLPKSSYTAGLVSCDLNNLLPSHIAKRLALGFKEINKNMKGFICDSALMIAPETRTSTPVRICRHKDSLECTGLEGLYPCGEGSGYAGGIVSSAMDGINSCQKIAEGLF